MALFGQQGASEISQSATAEINGVLLADLYTVRGELPMNNPSGETSYLKQETRLSAGFLWGARA